MKIAAQDEYGLRILLRIARSVDPEGVSIPQLSELEGLSAPYVGKLTRTLRMAGLIRSTRGHKGGYILSKPAEEIKINDALKALGGKLYDSKFCGSHSGQLSFCTNSVDCSVRSLWRVVQFSIDQLLDRITLADLAGSEKDAAWRIRQILEEHMKTTQEA